MSHPRHTDASSDAWGLPGELLAMLDARAAHEGTGRAEALARCLYEWRAERIARQKSQPPPSTTDREMIPGHPAASDRTGDDARP